MTRETCRCEHPHHPAARWCYTCERPIQPPDPLATYRRALAQVVARDPGPVRVKP